MLVGSGFEGLQCTNTKYATGSHFVYVLKMEYVSKINIFDLNCLARILQHADDDFPTVVVLPAKNLPW